MEAKKEFWPSVWAELQELNFVTACFTWLFMALSRLAEPLMTLSALYMIVQTGVTSLHVDAIYNSATASMIGAPEIILPGAFVLAGREYSDGNKGRAGVLFTMAGLFVILTLVTLADLFIWHLPAKPGHEDPRLQLIMFARCAVSVGYSIIFRVITHKDEKTNDQPNDPPNTPQAAPVNPPVNPPTGTTVNPPASTPGFTPQSTPANTTTNPPVDPPKTATENPPTGTPNNPPKSRQEARQKADTKQRVEAYRRRHPNATQDAIARALNVSLRTVQRYDNPGGEDGARLRIV